MNPVVWICIAAVAVGFVAGALFGIFFDAKPFNYPHDPRPGEEV